eukprot:COSAG01_NODE_3555_length_5940_cov_3.170519_1_plen_267_part_10
MKQNDTAARVKSAQVSEAFKFSTCLDREFVQKEVRWAYHYQKPFITVFEEDRRRQGFFDYAKAHQLYGGTEWEPLLNIDSVTYRRDKFEAQAMVARIIQKASDADVAAATEPINAPGHWDFFLSHGQAAAGDQVKMLCFLLRAEGKSVWYDNEMGDRSTPAMEEGVRHSKNFVLFLSGDQKVCSGLHDAYQTCLDRSFVQKELEFQRTSGSKILTIFEDERRRQGFFDYHKAWKKYGGTEWEPLLNIDSVTYRRDKFEAQAMVARII